MNYPAQTDPDIDKFTKLLNDFRESDKNEQAQLTISRLINEYLPPWFIPMLNDKKRNIFYEKMIKRHVKGKTVLLKSIGLAAQMARCGLPVCASPSSKIPFFKDRDLFQFSD